MKPWLKIAAIVVCLLPVSFQAQAISRYTSTSMTCSAIHQKIANEGAAIFRWTQKPNISRYGRYVINDGLCGFRERAQPVYIPSSDKAQCQVYECQRYDPRDDPLERFFLQH
jgi:hypothetical protein